MAAGDKEIVLASEEVQRQNLRAAINYGNETRTMVRELGVIVNALQNQVITQNKTIDQQRLQLANLQQQFYQKGTVSYHTEEGVEA
jgi:uncharacterized coiled-coil protein SlyX